MSFDDYKKRSASRCYPPAVVLGLVVPKPVLADEGIVAKKAAPKKQAKVKGKKENDVDISRFFKAKPSCGK